jgi:hypothetical protein
VPDTIVIQLPSLVLQQVIQPLDFLGQVHVVAL